MPTAHAGPNRSCFTNEPLALDGTASTGAFDGLQTDGRYSIQWDFGYGGWTFEGSLTAPIAFPKAGVYIVTLTVYDSAGVSASDTATITVNDIVEGSETVVGDTGNAITNGANLKAAITAAASLNNPVITLTAGATYDFDGVAYALPNRTGTGYCTIRTSAHTSLPSSTSRVNPTDDAANMPIVTPGDKVGSPAENSAEAAFTALTGTTPGHHYRFLGIRLVKKFPTLNYTNPVAFFDLGSGGATSVTQLPHHIQIDRCIIDGGDTTHQTTRGVALRATDSAVVNSYIYRIQLTSADVQAVWIGSGERLAVINNFLSASTENMMSGGADIAIFLESATAQATGNDATHIKLAASASAVNDFYNGMGIFIQSGTGAAVSGVSNPGVTIVDYDGTTKIATLSPAWQTVPDDTSVYRIGNFVPADVIVRRNYMWKDPCWRSGAACYYGVNFNVKNIFEIKQGRRWSVEGNIFENHWQEDQNWAVVITAKNQDGKQPWSTIKDLDFSHNKMLDVGNGFQLLTSDFFWPSLGSERWLFRHNVVAGVGEFGGFHNFALCADGGSENPLGMGEQVIFVRNSTDQDGTGGSGRGFMFETSTKFRNLIIYGNIFKGEITQNGPTGQAALIAATGGGAGSFSFTKNGLYRPSGTLPTGNSTVATPADVKYVDIAAQNLALRSDSPFLTTGPAGGRAGADVTTVDLLTVGAISGNWGEVTVQISGLVVLGGRVTIG